MSDIQIIWDLDDEVDGNVQHISEHGLTREEVDEVLMNAASPTGESRATGRSVSFGWTSTGRYIIVIWEHIQDDPLTIYPVTAYDVLPPRS